MFDAEWSRQMSLLARLSSFTLHHARTLLVLTTDVFHCLLHLLNRAMFDAEWRHQTSLLARPSSFTLQQRHPGDVRLQGSDKDWIREGETWSHEQIMDLIVGGGKFVHPDKVKVRRISNRVP
jgi:hypothetical protein